MLYISGRGNCNLLLEGKAILEHKVWFYSCYDRGVILLTLTSKLPLVLGSWHFCGLPESISSLVVCWMWHRKIERRKRGFSWGKTYRLRFRQKQQLRTGTGRMLTRSYDELSKVKHVLLVGAGRHKAGKEHLTTPKLPLWQLPVGLRHVDPACLKITSVSLGQLGTNQTLWKGNRNWRIVLNRVSVGVFIG